MRLQRFQCWPSSPEKNTWPSEVPRYSLFGSCGSASSELTFPPSGPTCFHCCAGVATQAASPKASAATHFEFIGMDSPKSAGALTSQECRRRGRAPAPVQRCRFGAVLAVLKLVLVLNRPNVSGRLLGAQLSIP